MYKLLIGSLFFFSVACSGNEKKSESTETATENNTVAEKKYACPMKCEGDKTYDAAGKCPVCKMDLQEVALAESDTTGHAH